MKKIITFMLASAMIFSMAACGNSSANKNTSSNSESSVSTENNVTLHCFLC